MEERICREIAEAFGKTEEGAARCAPTESGRRNDLVAEYSRRYQVSRATVYRWARAGGWASGRAGVGGRKKVQSSKFKVQSLELCAALIQQTASRKYAPKMSTKLAIQVGERSGYWQRGELTIAMVNRYMREHCPRRPACGMEPPPIPRKPDYVNQVGQFDVSNCAQFFLMDDGRIAPQDESIYWTKNKRGRGPAIKRGVYTEVLTNAFYVEYFLGAESTETEIPILHRAWLPKRDPSKYPLQGMPEILIADKGAGLKNNYCDQLFENLGIDFRSHKKGNPRAKGSVETLMWYVERRIESLLRFEPATNIERLNELVYTELVNVNGIEEHSRYGLPRSVAFANWVRVENQKLPPREFEHFQRLGYREHEIRISNGLSFSFQGRPYTFMADSENYSDPAIMALKGQTVTVMYSPFDAKRVRVRTADGREYFPALLERDAHGYPLHAVRMKSPGLAPSLAVPIVVQNIRAAQDMDIAAVGGGPVKGFAREDELQNIRVMVKPAREWEAQMDAVDEGIRIPRLEAKKKLQEMLGKKLEREESEELNQRWGEFVSEAEIEQESERKKEEEGSRISRMNKSHGYGLKEVGSVA